MGDCVLYLLEGDLFYCCRGALTIKVPRALTHWCSFPPIKVVENSW